MMTCKYFEKSVDELDNIIDAYIEGTLDKVTKENFEEHYFDCEACFSRLRLADQLPQIIKEYGPRLFKNYLREERQAEGTFNVRGLALLKHPLRISVGLALVVCLLYIFVWQPAQVTPNLIPLLYMEELIDAEYRGSEVKLLSPLSSSAWSNKVQFQWVAPGSESYILKIINNQGETVFEQRTTENFYEFSLDKYKLKPGLYYWNLVVQDELYAGKFFIVKSTASQ